MGCARNVTGACSPSGSGAIAAAPAALLGLTHALGTECLLFAQVLDLVLTFLSEMLHATLVPLLDVTQVALVLRLQVFELAVVAFLEVLDLTIVLLLYVFEVSVVPVLGRVDIDIDIHIDIAASATASGLGANPSCCVTTVPHLLVIGDCCIDCFTYAVEQVSHAAQKGVDAILLSSLVHAFSPGASARSQDRRRDCSDRDGSRDRPTSGLSLIRPAHACALTTPMATAGG